MSTRQAADRRIRAASLAVPGLDVRGPVSRALGQIPVPLAEPVDEAGETEPVISAPTRTASRPRAEAATRVLKPFADTPWPTQKAKADPRQALSGLTADERRVHRILLETLAIQGQMGYDAGRMSTPGLSYTEKQNLAVLDLAFIDTEIAKMKRGLSTSSRAVRLSLAVGATLTALTAGVLMLAGEGDAALFVSLMTGVALFLAVGFASLVSGAPTSASTPRRKIYDALRELALLVNDAPISDALHQADAVIDRLADADDGRRLRLNDAPTAAASGAANRARARS